MNDVVKTLPVIESCDGCGACCLVVTLPPFRHEFAASGEEVWERLKWDRPDLFQALIGEYQARKTNVAPSYGTPCLWLDQETRRCRRYEHRPRACREFALGAQDCRDARRRAGIVESARDQSSSA
jgi:Fe-S-cluster containining protein